MHNESRATPKVVETETEVETIKPSKLSRIKSNAITATWIIIPVAVTGGLTYVSYRMASMQFETNRLNLETAQLANLAAKAAQKS